MLNLRIQIASLMNTEVTGSMFVDPASWGDICQSPGGLFIACPLPKSWGRVLLNPPILTAMVATSSCLEVGYLSSVGPRLGRTPIARAHAVVAESTTCAGPRVCTESVAGKFITPDSSFCAFTSLKGFTLYGAVEQTFTFHVAVIRVFTFIDALRWTRYRPYRSGYKDHQEDD